MSGVGSIPGLNNGNPVVFMDMSIGGHNAGRITIEVVPFPSDCKRASHCFSGVCGVSTVAAFCRVGAADSREFQARCLASLRREAREVRHVVTVLVHCLRRQFCTGEYRFVLSPPLEPMIGGSAVALLVGKLCEEACA